MTSITVKFYGFLCAYLGLDTLSLEADDVGQVMAQVEEKFGAQLRAKFQALGIQADQEIQDYCLLLLDGHNVSRQSLQQVKLRGGRCFAYFPSRCRRLKMIRRWLEPEPPGYFLCTLEKGR
jgi:molybdopterin converting factor small subunit